MQQSKNAYFLHIQLQLPPNHVRSAAAVTSVAVGIRVQDIFEPLSDLCELPQLEQSASRTSASTLDKEPRSKTWSLLNSFPIYRRLGSNFEGKAF